MRTLAAIAICCAALGQTPAPAFEVSSIKAAPDPRNALEVVGNRFHMVNELYRIILLAYGIQPYQLSGGPAWVMSDRFEIQAKAAKPSTEDEMKIMARTLLAGRFNLRVHRETKAISAYVLTVDKKGPKFTAAKDTPPQCGSYGCAAMRRGKMNVRGSTMERTALLLTLNMDRPVLDKTNLTGRYDFDLTYDQSSVTGMPGQPQTPTEGASIFAAIQDLGLKLEPQNAPVEFLVIDSIEHPSEN